MRIAIFALGLGMLAACSGQVTPDASAADGSDGNVTVDATMGDTSADVQNSADAAQCGQAGGACCAGSTCSAGGCCVDAHCVAAGAACGDGLGMCASGSCGSCGGAGQACCMEVQSDVCSGVTPVCPGCTAPGTTCSSQSGGTSGTCEACGGEGMRCCGVGTCIGEFSTCLQGMCTSQCGHPGEPCCNQQTCRDGGCCMSPGTGTTGNGTVCVAAPTCGCSASHCTQCGALDHACCAGGTCEIGQGNCAGDGDGGMACVMSPHP